jgi:hypothetical protein
LQQGLQEANNPCNSAGLYERRKCEFVENEGVVLKSRDFRHFSRIKSQLKKGIFWIIYGKSPKNRHNWTILGSAGDGV